MFELTLVNLPDSGLDKATVTVAGDLDITLGSVPGAIATKRLEKVDKDFLDLTISVFAAGASTTVTASNIDWNSGLYVQAVNPSLFVGNFVHARKKGLPAIGRPCLLRCAPSDKPVNGPGCIDCPPTGGPLRFVLCC